MFLQIQASIDWLNFLYLMSLVTAYINKNWWQDSSKRNHMTCYFWTDFSIVFIMLVYIMYRWILNAEWVRDHCQINSTEVISGFLLLILWSVLRIHCRWKDLENECFVVDYFRFSINKSASNVLVVFDLPSGLFQNGPCRHN